MKVTSAFKRDTFERVKITAETKVEGVSSYIQQESIQKQEATLKRVSFFFFVYLLTFNKHLHFKYGLGGNNTVQEPSLIPYKLSFPLIKKSLIVPCTTPSILPRCLLNKNEECCGEQN
jgi:hypothetical protein